MTILFDLDGTLTDPYLGISRCIEYALGAIDSSVPDGTDLSTFIGPPLRGTLLALCGDEERAGRALAAYRERFAATGLYENVVYQGVPAMLDDLRGHRLYVCTAKPAVYAKRIIEHFGLGAYFAGVYGCELDGTRGEKADLIAWLLQREGLESATCVMVGDRSHDMVAAARNGVRGLGALWGYGSEAELVQAGAERTFRSPAELAAWFQGLGSERTGSVYGAAARRYAAHSLTSPHNALYERPAMEALIGDVHGLAVLDLGCGAGVLMRTLVEGGASRVVGIERDAEIAEFARTNLAPGAQIVEADAELPFPAVWDGAFDVVVASLVLHYFPRWDAVLDNVRRALRGRGRLLFSVNHPGDASDGELCGVPVSEYWPTLDITVTTYRWTFRGMRDVLARCGFDVEQVVEPVPLAEMRESAPSVFDDLTQHPAFVLVGARKR